MFEKGVVRSTLGLIFGAFLTLLSFLSAAMTNVFVKLIDQRLHPSQILLCQNIFGLTIILLLCLYYHKKILFFKSHHYSLLFLRSIAGLGSFFFLFTAIQHLSVSVTILLLNTAPLFIPFLLFIFLREKIKAKVWLGIIPGFLGLLLILKPNGTIAQWYTFIALLAGFCSAIIFISLRKLHLYAEPMLRILFYLFLFATLITLPFAIDHWKYPSSHDWWLVLAASASSFFAQTAITLAMRYGSPKALAPLCYMSVIFGLVFDWSIWHIVPSLPSLIGMGLVICGGIIAILIENRSIKSSDQKPS